MNRTLAGLGVFAILAMVAPRDAQAYSNGRLPGSALSRIYHPSVSIYLRDDAAASWNAMRNYIRARGVDIYPGGSISAYRTYSQQVYAKRVYGSNAATPGTSNHGWGLAVDLATQRMRWAIDRWGSQFGWAKRWSDASWEWWHLKYRSGVWNGRNPGAGGGGGSGGVLKKGSRGAGVKKVQNELKKEGFKPGPSDGIFGTNTAKAVKAFQRKEGLKADGIVGPKTKKALFDDEPKKKKKKAPATGGGSGGGSGGVLKMGSKGEAVKKLQRALEKNGHDVGAVDGVFGPRTLSAVKAFQKKKKLAVDGIVGPQTKRALGL